jgi:hypothetical protein
LLIQVQVWTVSTGTIGDEQKQVARELLVEARQRFRQAVTVERQTAAQAF